MGIFSFFKKKKTPPPVFIDRRQLPRWKITSSAKIKWQARDYLHCEVLDLNMKGFSLVMEENFSEPHNLVDLYFNEKYFFQVDISVIWHREVDDKHVYGLKISKIRDQDKEKIYQMMKENFGNFNIPI